MHKIHIRHDPEITLISYTTRKLLKVKEQSIYYYLLQNNKVLSTTRDNNDYNNLYKIITGIEKALDNNSFYPVLSDLCLYCAFKKRCSQGKWF